MQESKITQVHGVNPQEFKESIISDIRAEFEKLSKSFQPIEPPKYLTRQEVAKILKISLVTLSDWNKKGILKPYRLGNLVRYKQSELDQALISMNKKS
ncbi:helix-turn-helix domain-containing protein [Lutibacter sp. B1]|uniref:helix-turn-helix domain-containing protein n=1 Tax=Lutibacter sp. B1 TaxID=2725996 RepID=UPI001456905E|nr:helix-turn-helix domain-containing protein [Lutibacter sp. B1]NLP59230.1 helix-turn-helix domain-containing protein [Lutibacter sp. B1]